MKMRKHASAAMWAIGFAMVTALAGCASGGGSGSSGDRNRITAEEFGSVDVSTLYEVVQRLRPRWLEVRSPRGIGGVDTEVVVFLDRTYVGGVDELRRMGTEVAVWLQYRSGSDVAGELFVPGDRHVEGAIIIHSREERR
jgi:hypothetical protein